LGFVLARRVAVLVVVSVEDAFAGKGKLDYEVNLPDAVLAMTSV